MSVRHTQPGVESEIDVVIQASPGASVVATLSGAGVITMAQQSSATGDDGALTLTWRINQFGGYSVSGTAGGAPFSCSGSVGAAAGQFASC